MDYAYIYSVQSVIDWANKNNFKIEKKQNNDILSISVFFNVDYNTIDFPGKSVYLLFESYWDEKNKMYSIHDVMLNKQIRCNGEYILYYHGRIDEYYIDKDKYGTDLQKISDKIIKEFNHRNKLRIKNNKKLLIKQKISSINNIDIETEFIDASKKYNLRYYKDPTRIESYSIENFIVKKISNEYRLRIGLPYSKDFFYKTKNIEEVKELFKYYIWSIEHKNKFAFSVYGV